MDVTGTLGGTLNQTGRAIETILLLMGLPDNIAFHFGDYECLLTIKLRSAEMTDCFCAHRNHLKCPACCGTRYCEMVARKFVFFDNKWYSDHYCAVAVYKFVAFAALDCEWCVEHRKSSGMSGGFKRCKRSAFLS